MHHKLKQVTSSSTFQQSAITSISTFLSAGFGAIYYLILAKIIGVREYGLFSLGLSILLAGSSLADLGMGPSIVRFVSGHKQENTYAPYANVALRTKLVTSTVAILIFTIFASFIANNILHQPEVADLLPWVGFSIASFVLFSFSASMFQGLQEFWWWGGIQVGANIFRLIIMGLFIILGILSAKVALILFGAALLSAFIVSFFKLDKKILTTRPDTSHALKFWEFNKWTAIFTISASIVGRLDTILAARYVSISQVGIYSLALTMTSFLPQLSGALGAVTGPKFAGFSNSKEAKQYLRKALFFSSSIALVCCILMIPAAAFVIWFTGKDYSDAFIPFLILLLAVGLFTATNPVRDIILYGYKKPKFFFFSSLIQAVVVCLIGATIIPRIGIVGASISMLISQLVLIVLSIFYYSKLKMK